MNLAHEDNRRISEKAAQYLGALMEGNAERDGLFAWLAESPRHVEEFLFVLKAAQEVAGLTDEQVAHIEAMAADVDSVGNIVPLNAPSPTLPRRSQGREKNGMWLAGIAATFVIGIAAWWMTAGVLGWEMYTTAVGEQRAVKLPDGSMVHLNTRSELKVRFDEGKRAVRLVKGEALFDVERDPARPFRVQAGEASIQVLGTQFDVYRHEAGTRISVLQGKIAVSRNEGKAQELEAGQQAEIHSDGKILRPRSTNIASTVAWRQRRLVFEGETLAAIAAEFNRYNTTPQIRIVGTAATEQHFSGTFDADAPEKLVQTLKGDDTLLITRTRDEILIRPR